MDQSFKSNGFGPDRLASAEQFLEFWQMPLRLWSNWCFLCFGMSAAHPLRRKEEEDRQHAQLVVPEPIKASDDRELFA